MVRTVRTAVSLHLQARLITTVRIVAGLSCPDAQTKRLPQSSYNHIKYNYGVCRCAEGTPSCSVSSSLESGVWKKLWTRILSHLPLRFFAKTINRDKTRLP
ncbi:hypothetical protein AALO_G00203730 [Alosa alosa]|uniref:Secreted protein n=1 Tax=Alosa alosa TaxID=278164 RepID=A0AAV6G379_9TELE|nr:hypothetical protein AALO_G00203730 [Alosa alosa]